MYFANRTQAGKILANQIEEKYGNEECAVVALSDGGVVIGMQIAMRLRCVLTMLLIDEIELPREMVAIAGISQDGSFSYNKKYAPSEIEEMVSEYRNVIEQGKLDKLHAMNRSLGSNELIKPELLRHKNIILASDGLSSGFSIDLALEYLKPQAINKQIVATPLASINAVDRIHVLADDIYCLSAVENYISTDHYYDTNDVPTRETVVQTISQIVSQWKE